MAVIGHDRLNGIRRQDLYGARLSKKSHQHLDLIKDAMYTGSTNPFEKFGAACWFRHGRSRDMWRCLPIF